MFKAPQRTIPPVKLARLQNSQTSPSVAIN
jgi:hypothetical protein